MLKPALALKSPADIEKMRAAGRVVAEALATAGKAVQVGVTTKELDAIVEGVFAKHGAAPLFKGFPGKVPFPACTCISVNEEVVHGIPGPRKLKEGDLLTLDTGCRLNGWCADSAMTVAVGALAPEKQKLWDVSEQTLALAIREFGRQRKWSQVARQIEEFVHQHGYTLVDKFVGHGIGREMHEEPQVPNFLSRGQNAKQDFWLDVGLVLAIEPMVNLGRKHTRVKNDHWTVETCDKQPSVHVEHTVALTPHGPEILTAREAFQ